MSASVNRGYSSMIRSDEYPASRRFHIADVGTRVPAITGWLCMTYRFRAMRPTSAGPRSPHHPPHSIRRGRSRPPASARPRSVAVFVESKRGLGAEEEPYFCTATTPDDGIAQLSTKTAALRAPTAGLEPATRRLTAACSTN